MERVPKHKFLGILTQLELLHQSFSSTAKHSSELPCPTACFFTFLETFIKNKNKQTHINEKVPHPAIYNFYLKEKTKFRFLLYFW
jgi:hypothetical protein